MTFAGINYFAVAIAALSGFAVGMFWYMALGTHWLKALGKRKEEMSPNPLPFVIAILALIVMAWMLAGLIGHMGEVTVWRGVVTGFFVWLGFVITTLGVNHTFQGAPSSLTAIDGGHWLAVLIVQGAIIGLFGV